MGSGSSGKAGDILGYRRPASLDKVVEYYDLYFEISILFFPGVFHSMLS